jgi:hypothetical protein
MLNWLLRKYDVLRDRLSKLIERRKKIPDLEDEKKIKFGKVARFHEQEAKERYWILRRDIEIRISYCMAELGEPFKKYDKDEDESVEKYIEKLQGKIYKISNNQKQPAVNKKGSKLKNLNPSHDETCKLICKLLYYYKIILIDQHYISRQLSSITLLWRDMNFVRTRMLSEYIIDPEKLPYQLDFCKSEAATIGAQDDQEVKALFAQSAEFLDFENTSTKKNKRARRSITSLMVILNNMRIQKLTEQVHKKKTYMSLFIILILLSLLLFFMNDHFLSQSYNKELSTARLWFLKIIDNHSTETSKIIYVLIYLYNAGVSFLLSIIETIVRLPTVFIYFAGLTGGFFSAIMKFEPHKRLPGDEIYVFWYRITKPFIGAFGALVIYIIANAAVFELEFIDSEIKNSLIQQPVSSVGFTFGFITGFTERLVLPTVK